VSRLAGGVFYAVGPIDQNPGAGVLEGGVTYTGPLAHKEVRRLLGRTRIYVSPALYDPFGLAAVEAALAGCALVLADLPSYRAIWEDSAIYFNSRSSVELAARLHALLENGEVLADLGARARARASSLYTAERMAAAYLLTYQRISLRYGVAL
jgi:glycosyltransferase involved in cell wall biosynthesis